MKKHKFQNIILFISFILILFIPILFMNRESGKISETENRYLVGFPKIFNDNGSVNTKGLRSGVENWLNDNIGLRDYYVKLHSSLALNVFKTSPSSKVEIGKDGWYFYTLDDNLKISNGSYPLSEELLSDIKHNQEKISKYFAKIGIEYVLILPPSKVSIYPEKIKSGNYSVRETPIDILANYLETNSTLKVIRLKESLLDAKTKEQVYFKTDTHWNEAGAYVAYQTVINKLNEFGLINTKPVEVNKIPSTRIGEFSAMMGDTKLLGEEETIETEILNPKAISIKNDIIDNIKQNYNLQNASYSFTNLAITGKKVLMYGDSMFAYWNLPELMAENFSEFNYVWSYNMQKEMIYQLKPDIILYDITERYINQIANFNQEFTFDILTNPQAAIISDNTPTSIERDKKYNINITVKNTSDESWSEENLVRFCIWQDGIDWGYRINIPEGKEIKSGEEFIFTLNDFQAPQADNTYIEYQMLQEGITYFGEKKRVDISVK